MLEQRPHSRRRHSARPPFPRILCAIDGGDGSDAAIEQAIAIAGDDATIVFAASWYGKGTIEGGPEFDTTWRHVVEQAVTRAEAGGAEAQARFFPTSHLNEAVLASAATYDLVVVGAHPHSRVAGIVLSEIATELVHRCPLPVLVARARPLAAGVVAATRALPADRAAVTAGTHLAARLGAELTIVHVPEHGDEDRRAELKAELANAKALLGRPLDYVEFDGPPARSIVDVAEGDGCGLVVVGSEGKQGLPALRSVSERVAHQAPCSVLVVRNP
jgi:nucleotide-binding universal stress UspA family protein